MQPGKSFGRNIAVGISSAIVPNEQLTIGLNGQAGWKLNNLGNGKRGVEATIR